MRKQIRPAVARNILAEAARLGVSQQGLAAAVGLSQPAMSRRMAGEVEFRLAELQAIAHRLNVPLEQLLETAPSEAVS